VATCHVSNRLESDVEDLPKNLWSLCLEEDAGVSFAHKFLRITEASHDGFHEPQCPPLRLRHIDSGRVRCQSQIAHHSPKNQSSCQSSDE
jgi:hypothetical protein